MNLVDESNSHAEIMKRRATGRLTWTGPALVLFARCTFSFLAQGLVATIYAARSSRRPWLDAGRWLPVYATLIDARCLAVLWLFTRNEGITLRNLISFDPKRWPRDIFLGLALIPISLVFILGGVSASSYMVFGTFQPPALFQPLPLLPSFYAVLVFPALWGLTEQMTYNGYLVPRLQVLSGSTAFAVAVVSFPWSFQHALLPLTFDPKFMLYRFLAPIPFSIFICLMYLRVRRLLPFVVAHWLMDGTDVLFNVLVPHFR